MVVCNVTWLSYFMAAVVGYYSLLFLLSLRAPRTAWEQESGISPMVVFCIAARNEELVIGETLRSLMALDFEHFLILLMNDASSDRTSDIGRSFPPDKVVVVDRGSDIAGRGKGDVLNHAFSIIVEMLTDGDPRLAGRDANNILIGTMDGDAQVEPDLLRKVAPYFTDPRVGGVQIGVRILNATSNTLSRMQDMEFIGFSALVQVARTHLGSVGLGGNGQFTRLSALISLRRSPWTRCLTEDLDIGLSLVQKGWTLQFCPNAFVSQQGLTKLRPLLRQRTRWIQGHYQCWKHLPGIWRASNRLSLVTRLDLTIYLAMVTLVVLVSFNFVVAVLSVLHVVSLENSFLSWWPEGHLHNLFNTLFTFGPLIAFIAYYQCKAKTPLRWWEVPAYTAAFSLYCYLSLIPTLRAWTRLALRRGGWAKTARVAVPAAENL